MDTVAGQPVIQPHGVSAGRKGLGKGEFCPALVHETLQRLGTGHALTLQCRRQIDALAILVEPHQHRHVGGPGAANAQVHGINQPIQAMGSVQLAADQLVAQAGPGTLALEVQAQAIGLGKALGRGNHYRGAVAQGHETDVQAVLFRRIAAVDPGQWSRGGIVVHSIAPVSRGRPCRLRGRYQASTKQRICQGGAVPRTTPPI
ncbi:hypothetical protein D3C80_970090 [compost metagenome]